MAATIAAAITAAVPLAPAAAASSTPVALQPSVPVATSVYALDRFERSSTSGWGTSERGGAWTTQSGAHSVSSGYARQRVVAGQTGTAFLNGASSLGTDLTADVSLDKAAVGGATYVSLVGRRVGTAGDYRARLKVQPSGVVTLVAARGETTLRYADLPGLRHAAGTKLSVRVQVTGSAPTTIRARAWKMGTAEPTAWHVTATDSTPALQKAGSLALATYASSAATNAPVTARFDNVTARPVVPNQKPVAVVRAATRDLVAQVDGAASSDPDGSITSHAWDFGDGTKGSGAAATHAYATPGTYTVTLTVTDDKGAVGTTTSTVTASKPNQAPVARAAVSTQDLVVTADGRASVDADGAIAAHAWTFGDGATGTGPVATHTYAAAGAYTVTLQTKDDRGAIGSSTAVVHVAPAAPVSAVPAVGTAPVTAGTSAVTSVVGAAVKPGPTNTGVRPGTRLTVHRGDIVVTTPGTVIDSMDIYGFVTIKAANVTIKNSRVRGSGPGTFNTGLINCSSALCKNALIEDVLLVPDHPSVWLDGVIGHDYTARRVNTYNVVDGFGVYNTTGPAANVRIESSYVHDLSYFSPDPNHSDNRTHNDAIQIQGGTNVAIVGNTLSAYLSKTAGTQNYKYPQAGFGVILTPNVSAVSGSVISDNWFEGSYIPVKLTTGKKGPMNFGKVTGNRFARDMRNTPMNGVNQWFTILTTPDMTIEAVGNVYADTLTPVTVRRDSGTGTAP